MVGIAAGAAILLSLGLITWTVARQPGDAPPPVFRWICTEPGCGNQFDTDTLPLSPAQAEPDPAKAMVLSSIPPPAQCPKCGKDHTIRAYKCPNCSKYFDRSIYQATSETVKAPCPHCRKQLPEHIEG